jgi:hypothetical protein
MICNLKGSKFVLKRDASEAHADVKQARQTDSLATQERVFGASLSKRKLNTFQGLTCLNAVNFFTGKHTSNMVRVGQNHVYGA